MGLLGPYRKESARTLDKFAISIKVAFMSIQSTDLANWYGQDTAATGLYNLGKRYNCYYT